MTSTPDISSAALTDVMGHKETHASQQTVSSLDYLVSACQQCRRHRNTQCMGGLEIDHQLELGRLLDRNLRRLCALQNLLHDEAHVLIQGGSLIAIRHQATGFGKRANVGCGWQTVLECEIGDLFGRESALHNN